MLHDEDDNINRAFAEPFTNTHDKVENNESNDNEDCAKNTIYDHVKQEDDM